MKKIFHNETKKLLADGVKEVHDIVAPTMGGKGKNIVMDNGFGSVMIINDGVTIAKNVELEDEIMNAGATLAKEVADKTNEDSGDGTTTSIVLLNSFLQEMMDSENTDPRGLREEIKKELNKIIKELDKRAIPITEKDYERIAYVSSLNKDIAKEVAKLYKTYGKDSLIKLEEGKIPGITVEQVPGIRLKTGYMAPVFINDIRTQSVKLEDIPVLCTKKKIESVNDILPLLDGMVKKGTSKICFFVEDISNEVLGFLAHNKLQGTLAVNVVKTSNTDDIASITGAKVVNNDNGLQFSTRGEGSQPLGNFDILGKAKKIESDKRKTIVISGNKKAIEQAIKDTETELNKKLGKIEEIELKERLAQLKGGVSVITVGGESEQETKEMKLKMEDALNATKSAIEEGIIRGGGLELFDIAKGLNRKNEASMIMYEVCQSPIETILANADENVDKVLMKVGEKGYNVITRQYEDFIQSGIIDPVKTTKSALKNAISTGLSILTAEGAIINLKPKQDEKIGR